MIRMPSRRAGRTVCRDYLLMPLLLLAAAALTACGSGGGSQGVASTTASSSSGATTQSCSGSCGGAMVTLTDAPGDFVSYIVNVVSLQLTRADGTVVQTLPVTTQVDFAQLVNLSEIVSTAQIPAGRYVSASMTLDFSSASIVVDNGSDTPVTIAADDIIDGATSLPLAAPNSTQMTVTLSLPSDSQLVVTPGTIANLALDFNLAASNTIGPSTSSPTTVTVNPELTASLVPDTTKQTHVRGPLVSVDTGTSTYIIGVRPFYNGSGTNGQLTVTTTATTTYSINGTGYTGSAGLAQLATLTAGTLTAAYGTWDRTTQTFTASSVLAGSSVTGAMLDSIEGTVVARTDDTLTVADGVLFPMSRGRLSFAPQVTVTVGTGTTVTEEGEMGPFSLADISVGQHAQFFGTLSSMSSSTTLDATSGSALLLLTPVVGTVSSTASSLVTLDLQSLDGRAPSIFNFAGTGASSADDATPTAYAVALPAPLSAAGLSTGLPASFTGFIAPFGSAPPDFNAVTVVNYAQTRALLLVQWASPGVTAPFATLTGSELLISQATLQSSSREVIRIASAALNPAALSTGLQIVPDTSFANPQYAIGHLKSRTIDSFSTFSDFVTALTTELNGTNEALQVFADGPYNATTGVFSADQMIVGVND
jgi:hypothetical protein